MAESENTRLGNRLISIGTSLGGTSGNGHAGNDVASELSDELITALAKSIDPFVCGVVAEALAPLAKRIVELEARVVELQQAPSMKYCGVWEPEKTYFVGDFVTQEGSLWACEQACTGVRPPASVWTLAVKRGRDGKSAK